MRVIRHVHLWLGLSLGAVFAVLGLTGSALVFYVELDRLTHPSISSIYGVAQDADWDQASRTLRTRFPALKGPWRLEVAGDGRALPARYLDPPATQDRAFAPLMVWLSPDGRQVLRKDYWGNYPMTWIYDLHFRLLMGKAGGQVVGLIGLLALLLLWAGLMVWWPRGGWAKALRWKSSAKPIRRWRDLHKLLGLAGLIPLMLLTGTGVMLALPDASRTGLNALGLAQPYRPVLMSKAQSGVPIPVSLAMQRAQAALPGARIAWVEMPGLGRAAYRVRMQVPGDPSRRFPHSMVWIDSYSGRVLRIDDLRRDPMGAVVSAWLHPLHNGSAGGDVGRWLAFCAGLLPAALYYSGLRRWRLRRACSANCAKGQSDAQLLRRGV